MFNKNCLWSVCCLIDNAIQQQQQQHQEKNSKNIRKKVQHMSASHQE